MNHLYYGDNLAVLRDSIRDESVDLIYLDPPFNSNASYNVLFRGPDGAGSAAQIEAFDDTWHWNDTAAAAFGEVLRLATAMPRKWSARYGVSSARKYRQLYLLSTYLKGLHNLRRTIRRHSALFFDTLKGT